nr:hypothetical protein [Pseudarthrobacter sulfonivorans]
MQEPVDRDVLGRIEQHGVDFRAWDEGVAATADNTAGKPHARVHVDHAG